MEELTLTTKWDKTFAPSPKVKHQKVTFHNRYGITLAADMYEKQPLDYLKNDEITKKREKVRPVNYLHLRSWDHLEPLKNKLLGYMRKLWLRLAF